MFFTIICATLGISATSVLVYKLYPKCKQSRLSDVENQKINSKSRNQPKINSKSIEENDINKYFSIVSESENDSEDDELETKHLTKYQMEEKIMFLNNESSSIICV